MTLGNILPTAKSRAATEAYARRESAAKKAVAANELTGLTARVVGGETRYYKDAATYAIVGSDLKVKWFEVRADGDYPIRTRRKSG